jgi:hypothetical protein
MFSNGAGMYNNIAPLIFTSSYKCLDLFIKWLLESNGQTPRDKNWNFCDKISSIAEFELSDNENIPSIFNMEERIFDCLECLYKKLKKYRHSIVHSYKFKVNDSSLSISDGDGSKYTFERKEMFSLAGVVSICIDTIIEDSYDYVTLRQLATMLDTLSYVHNCRNFDLTDHESRKIRVRVNPIETDPHVWELTSTQRDKLSDWHKPFWLHLVGPDNEGIRDEWIIPIDSRGASLEDVVNISFDDFEKYKIES